MPMTSLGRLDPKTEGTVFSCLLLARESSGVVPGGDIWAESGLFDPRRMWVMQGGMIFEPRLIVRSWLGSRVGSCQAVMFGRKNLDGSSNISPSPNTCHSEFMV